LKGDGVLEDDEFVTDEQGKLREEGLSKSICFLSHPIQGCWGFAISTVLYHASLAWLFLTARV
jgi:hypothetical protein